MASDNHASYARIGFTVVAGVLAVILTLVYVAGIGDKSSEVLVETYYDKPVGGLTPGSAVNFRGVKIGEVRSIDFTYAIYDDADDADAQRVSILMALDGQKMSSGANTPESVINAYVQRGLRASVVSSGITGISRIEFSIPDAPLPPARLSWKPRHPLVPPQPSLLDSFSDAVTKFLNRTRDVNFAEAWSNVQSIAESLSELSSSANEAFRTERAEIISIVRNVSDLSHSLNELVGAVKENPSLLLRPADPEPLPETER